MATEKPTITVALPLWRARDIAWLALESLCRQVTDQQWELIIAEETDPRHEPFTKDRLAFMVNRLRDAGCVEVTYLPITAWIPLSEKWRIIAKMAHPNSKAFILQAADCYSEPNRLQRTHEALANNDWTHTHKGVFLDLKNNRKALYQHPRNYPTALNMAVRTQLLRNLPPYGPGKGVDRWLFNNATIAKGQPLRVEVDKTDGWLHSLDTHSFNNISMNRGKKIAHVRFPFKPCPPTLRIADMLPPDIVERLQQITKDHQDEAA